MNLRRALFVGFILICLSACAQVSPETTPSPTQTSTPIPIAAATLTPTPIPTQLAGILKHWREYEIALAQSMIPSSPTDEVICEWEVLGESVNELYVWAACTTTVPIPQTDDSYPRIHTVAVIHLGEEGEVLNIKRPSGGMNYANDIREMFPVDAQEKFFSKSYDYQSLTDHLLLRRDNPYMSPLVVLDAARPTHTPTPTSIKSDLPEGLMVVFITDDTIWVWKEGELHELISRSSIFGPSLSHDGKWVMFYQKVKQEHPRYEVWAVRSDGSDLHRLLSTDEITSLAEDDSQLILDQISWLPNNHQLVFNTQELTEGPPGYRPSCDLYLLDISGEITKLADPGEGGDFYPSPDGRYLAVAKPSRISLLDLETGTHRTLLEVDPFMGPIGPPGSPLLYWDKNSQFITTTILPEYVYYPYMYSGELEQIWRLGINGQTDIIVEVDPLPGLGSAIRFSPHAMYYFYFEAGRCLDGAAWIIHLRSLSTGKEILEIPCTFSMPEWAPDGKHFLYKEEGKWILGTVGNASQKHLEFLDIPLGTKEYPSLNIRWIDQFYFLKDVKNSEGCTIYLGSLDGIITEIFHTNSSFCPGTSHSISTTSTLFVPEIPLTVYFPANYSLTKNDELHLRGSFLSYGFFFFSEDSIAHYVEYCATTEMGGETFCNSGNYPDLETLYGQRKSFENLCDYGDYKLEEIGDRYYFTSPYFGRKGSHTKTKEYTTFVDDIKIDIWISLASYMDYQPEDVLQLRSIESDQLFRLFYLDTN